MSSPFDRQLARSESVVYASSRVSSFTRTCRLPVRARQHRAVAHRKRAGAMRARQSEDGQASRAAERSRTWCLGRASQMDGWLVPPPAVGRRRTLCGRAWKGRQRHSWLLLSLVSVGGGHVVEVQRTNVARSTISSSDSSCPEQDWRIVTIIQSWNRVTLRAAKRLP